MNVVETSTGTLIYMQGRRYVVSGNLTTVKRRRPRVWRYRDAVECRRVFRAPLVTFMVCVARH